MLATGAIFCEGCGTDGGLLGDPYPTRRTNPESQRDSLVSVEKRHYVDGKRACEVKKGLSKQEMKMVAEKREQMDRIRE